MARVSGKQLLVALGANQSFGDLSPHALICMSCEAVSLAFAGEMLQSALYGTPCFPAGAGPDYVNAVIRVTLRHKASADQVLQKLHEIEARFGRTRIERWGTRTLDLDLLAMDDTILPDPETQSYWRNLPPADQSRLAPNRLILPHPRLQDRAFVLVPMADVAPDWRHPILGKTVTEMLAALPAQDRAEVRRLNPAASD